MIGLRALRVLVVLLAFAASGAAGVRAAAELGATIESVVYADEDRVLSLWSHSTIPVTFVFDATGGWGVDADEVTLAHNGDYAEVGIIGTGVDAAPLHVRVRATDPGPADQVNELLLTAFLYTSRPANYLWIVVAFAATLLIVAILAAWRWRQRSA